MGCAHTVVLKPSLDVGVRSTIGLQSLPTAVYPWIPSRMPPYIYPGGFEVARKMRGYGFLGGFQEMW